MPKLSNEVRDLLIKRMIEKVTVAIRKLAEEDRVYNPEDEISITYKLDIVESSFTAKRDVVIGDMTFAAQGEISMNDLVEFVIRVLRITAFSHCEDLFWRTDNQYAPITFFIQCSDVFDWATSDCEMITLENIDVLEQSFKEAIRSYGAALFCARVRKKRPMDRFLEGIQDDDLSLKFKACGPERQTSIVNPTATDHIDWKRTVSEVERDLRFYTEKEKE